MPDPDAYRVIVSEGSAETRVQGSCFLAFTFPAASEEEAAGRVESLRKTRHDATHVCFAWRIGRGAGEKRRSSDAGEPAGTAGAPLLAALERAGVSDALVAVVRWFGGTKLGTGGLARAYGECARLAVENARAGVRVLREPLRASFPYPHAGRVLRIAEKHRAVIEDSVYAEEVTIRIAVPASRLAAFREEILDATGGTARLDP
ncbi:MAG: YigZ family protein [Candidatus Eisenbacteria bacterium]